jgi:gamma-glutamyltranspeptidase/glutathione hydrolase
MVPGTGVILSNAMAGFSPEGPNQMAPGHRMASSMTPAIVTQSGKLAMVLGSPGGDTIPSTVAQVFRNLVDGGMTIDAAVEHGRILHTYRPDRVRIERALPPPKEVLDDLVKRGHTVKIEAPALGDANCILFDPSGVPWGAIDPREGGRALGLPK